MNGAQAICRLLKQLEVDQVFGLPGTQNAPLFVEMGHSRLKTIVTSHEMGAGFAALGYAATSGRPGVLALIGGPGITYAITPVVEARLDSIPLLVLVFSHRSEPDRSFGAQQIELRALVDATCKRVFEPATPEEVLPQITEGWQESNRGEPGPVAVLIERPFLTTAVAGPGPISNLDPHRSASSADIDHVEKQLQSPGRHLLWVGRGTLAASHALRQVAEHYGAAVMTSPSARGALSEDHPLVLPVDLADVETVNGALAECDHVLALGLKFSHNSSRGWSLKVPPERLTHVDAAEHVLGANYPAHSLRASDVPTLLAGLVSRLPHTTVPNSRRHEAQQWCAAWRERLCRSLESFAGGRIRGVPGQSVPAFFRALSRELPHDTICVLDSGAHQIQARMHYTVRSPGGLLFPSGLQSMGFSLPAAVGAALAEQDRRVCVMMGDGGFRMCGMELLTALEHRLPLTVVVLDDGCFGLIRDQQLNYDGCSHGVALTRLDYAAWCAAVDVPYVESASDPVAAIASAVNTGRPHLVVVPVGETLQTRARHWKRRAGGIWRRWSRAFKSAVYKSSRPR